MTGQKVELKDRLNEGMGKCGKKAVDLSRDLNIPKSAVSQYLSGRSKSMESSRLYAIAEYLDVNPIWLLGFDAPMERFVGDAQEEAVAEIDLKPDVRRLVQLYSGLDTTDKNMLLMLAENLYRKSIKASVIVSAETEEK